MTAPNRKPETKAVAATGASAFGGGAVSLFVLWLLGTEVWDAPTDSAHATAAIAAVPFPVNGLVAAGITAILTLAAAYWAPHTHRPDLAGEVTGAHLDERMATQLEQIDAKLDDIQHTGPIARPDVGLRIMDEAHD